MAKVSTIVDTSLRFTPDSWRNIRKTGTFWKCKTRSLTWPQSELGTYFRMLEEQGIMDFNQNEAAIANLVSVLWFLGDFWMMNKELRCGRIQQLTPEMEAEYLQLNLFLTNQFMVIKG